MTDQSPTSGDMDCIDMVMPLIRASLTDGKRRSSVMLLAGVIEYMESEGIDMDPGEAYDEVKSLLDSLPRRRVQ